jgi:hypothetical protein
MAVDDSEIRETAAGLVTRHGRNAVAIARERVEELSRLGNQPEIDVALRILSKVEELTEAG